MTTRYEQHVEQDFRASLMLIAGFEPLEEGKTYQFRCYAGSEPSGYTMENRVATKEDISAVAAAIKNCTLHAFERPGRTGRASRG